jgi:hypothetical protein
MKVSFRLGMIMGIGLIFGFGCGDTGTPQPAPVVTGFAQGPITQFGSIFVNGTKFDTDTAVIVGTDGADTNIDDTNRPLGQVVVVEGIFNSDGSTGTATRVVFKSELKGPVDSEPVLIMAGGVVVAKELTVLGSTVIVEDGYTAFDENYSFETIMVNDIVEVSGLADGNGKIRATRIEKEGVSDGVTLVEVELRGESIGVSNATEDFGEGDLMMEGIVVSYDGMTMFEPANFDKSRFASSVFIEVKGTLDPAAPSVVMASEIEEEDDFGEDADKISVEGFVSDYVDNSEFMVGSQAVDASGATFIPTGLVLADGVEVEVEGPLVGGTLEATEVEFEGEESEVSATIEAGALGDNTLTLLGSIVIGFDGSTRWEDKESGADSNAPFSFSSLQVGDFVEVKAVLTEGDNLIATRIERDDLDDIEVEGRVGEYCADPTAMESIPDPNADPEADPVPMIDVPLAPCEAEGTWGGKAWVEVLGLRVEIRDTGPQTSLEVDEIPFMGTVADFIDQIGTNFVELEIDPTTPTAPHLAAKAEVETAD